MRPIAGETLRSGLVQGGIVVWHHVRADSFGWIETGYDSVRWDSIQDYYGVAGLSAVGYAYAELSCSLACRALAVATRLAGFSVNGKGYWGDVYGNGWFRTPVLLDSGVNRIVLRIFGYADQRVQFQLVPVPGPVMVVTEDVTAPDLIVADSSEPNDSIVQRVNSSTVIGVPVVNTTPTRIDSILLRFDCDTVVLGEAVVRNIPGLGVKKPAVRLNLARVPDDTGPVLLTVRLSGRDYEHTDTIRLRRRKLTEPHKETFVSRNDSSCQYYGLLYPQDYDPKKSYGLIVSLHGAGVEASGLVDCFKPKTWAFVVCPTNRRPFGFDWQDWGRQDALEVLAEVARRLPIDRNRICLTGHSMGGHGTWHIGLCHSDRFAALAPEAGWPSLQLYVPTFQQRSVTFAEPAQLAIREMCTRPDNPPAMLVNALNLPVFILHGGDDDNVPTIHGRNFALWLSELGYHYTYKEVPGQKHWWNYPDGLACVEDTDLMRFLESARREPGPRHIRFRTADLGQANSNYWVTIDRVRSVGRDAEIEAWALDSLVRIRTVNIEQLTVNLDGTVFFPGRVRLEIDGQRLGGKSFELPAHIILHQSRGRWSLGKARRAELHKTAELYGPAKQALMRPFVFVYGTADPGLADQLCHAATQEALRWWLIGNGTAEVLADTAPELARLSDRNIILYGGPAENRYTSAIARALPIRLRQGRMLLGKTCLGESLGAIVTYPNPNNPQRLVVVRMGTDPEATRLSLFWGIIGSGSAIPDFMVFDRTVRRYGWAGVKAAGFFGPDWNLDPSSFFLRQ